MSQRAFWLSLGRTRTPPETRHDATPKLYRHRPDPGRGQLGWLCQHRSRVDPAKMSNLDGWTALGSGNWSLVEGTLQGKAGTAGFLVSARDYADFDLRAEFWADEDCNSGIFIRCQDRSKITADNAYEVNIFDKRPDPTYATGAIVNFAKVAQPAPKAANRWNTFEVSARGERITVLLNGQQTAELREAKFKTGPIALQSAGGTVRFRQVLLRAA
jgi:Domain of Unknown Function (DUF1080)